MIDEIQPTVPDDVRKMVERVVSDMASGNRFDKLVSIRDAAQRLIALEKTKEEGNLKQEVERLSKQLSVNRARLGNLSRVVRATEPRKRKAKQVTA